MADIKSEYFIREALKEAEKAQKLGEVPIGAVITYNNKIVGRGYNKSIILNNPTAHAEIIALQSASRKLRNYRLNGCKIYVTVEPCAMCAGAMVWARISEIFFGVFDKKAGACGSVFNIANNSSLNHRIKVNSGILEEECKTFIRKFFIQKRNRNM